MNLKKRFFYIFWMGLNVFLNLYPFGKIDLLKENLSFLGYPLKHPFYLGIWGIYNGLSFYVLSRIIWKRFKIKYNKNILFFSCLSMAVSCLIPYTQAKNLLLDNLHIHIAMAGTLFYVFLWFIQLLDPSNFLNKEYERIFKAAVFITALSVLPTAYMGAVTGLSEIIFSLFFISLLLFCSFKAELKRTK